MFGIGRRVGFILFIVLMLLVQIRCQMARAMGKAMAQLKHATNDIKVKFKRVERLMVLIQNPWI
jgi:sec-independent protein translocase protein TatA